MLNREWAPVAIMVAVWGTLCAFTGPVVATGVVAGLIVLGDVLARMIGRVMFGAGGQDG